MVRTMSTHDAVLELNQKAGVANFLGGVQTVLQTSMARSAAATAGNTAATARAAEAAAREAAEQTVLQRRMADELDYQSGLQEHILQVERETNRHVQSIDRNLQETNHLIDEGLKGQRETNKTLRSIEDNAKLTNRLLAAQLRGMGVIAGKIDDSNRIQFASWRDGTDAGKEYIEWSKKAGRIIKSIGRYTKRMAIAREQDYQLNLKALIAQDARGVLARPEPVRQTPELPPEPEMTKPVAPARKSLVEPKEPVRPIEFSDFVRQSGTVVKILFTAIGLLAAIILPRMGGFEVVHPVVALVIGALLGCGVGHLVGLLVGAIMWRANNMEAERLEQEREWRRYKEACNQYREEEDRYRRDKAAYATKLRRWNDAQTHWRNECANIVNACDWQYQQDLQQYRQDRIDFLNECAMRAWELVAPETAWSVDNVSYMSTRLSNILKSALTDPPASGTLPKTRLPILASVGSLPATAPHMRLELAKMIKDNENNPEMRVAMPKAGEDPFAPYPFSMQPASAERNDPPSAGEVSGKASGGRSRQEANRSQGQSHAASPKPSGSSKNPSRSLLPQRRPSRPAAPPAPPRR